MILCLISGKEGLLHGKKIVLLESASEKKFDLPSEYSNRTCALSPATVKLLSGIYFLHLQENSIQN